MTAFKDDELLRREKANQDLEEKSGSERNELGRLAEKARTYSAHAKATLVALTAVSIIVGSVLSVDVLDVPNNADYRMVPPQSCYSGLEVTRGVGECRDGSYFFEDGRWSPCSGEILPKEEVGRLARNGRDDDCNGCADNSYGANDVCIFLPGHYDTYDTGVCESNIDCHEGYVCIGAYCSELSPMR